MKVSPGERQMNDVFCSLRRTWTSVSFQSALFIFLHPFPVSSLSAFCPSFSLQDRQGTSFTQKIVFPDNGNTAVPAHISLPHILRFDHVGLMNA